MEKVKCIKCGSVGYTASPESTRCEKCGSELAIDYGEFIFKVEGYYFFTKLIRNPKVMHISGGVK